MKEKRNTKAKSKQLAQVTIVAKSLVCDASSALNRSSPCDSNSVFEGVYIVYIKENRATKARFPFQRENNKGVDVMYSRACVASEA